MVRILTRGFELGSTIELSSAFATVAATITFPAGRHAGGLCLSLNGHTNAGSTVGFTMNVSSGGTEYYVRFVSQSDFGLTQSKVTRLTFVGASANHFNVQWGAAGSTMSGTTNTGGALGTSSGTIQAGWNLIEIYFKLASSGGAFVLKLNGVTEINFSGNTNPSSAGNLASISSNPGSNSNRFDDFVINDTSGSFDNAAPGDGFVGIVVPNGDVSVQWTRSTGANNYALVDEIPPSTSDYVESAVSGNEDVYDLTTITLAAGESINFVQPVVYAERLALGTPLEIEIGVESGATRVYAAPQTLNTSYGLFYGDQIYLDPNTSASWLQAGLSAAKAAIRNT